MNRKIFGLAALALGAMFTLCGCGAGGMIGDGWYDKPSGSIPPSDDEPTEGDAPNYQYNSIVEQGFKDAAEEPSSYFSLDRNTANYAYVRAQLNNGMTVANDSVRIEELVNYFSYGYPAPAEGEQLAVTGYLMDCPWNEAHKLASFGIRTQEAATDADCNNYTFLIDVSGSMSAHVYGTDTTCLGLVKYGIGKLVEGLGENDRVAIVTYASGTGVSLEPTLATEEGKKAIMKKVDGLRANGSTNGSGGLKLAYEQAEKYKTAEGNNRVILLTDGDFNVGIYDTEELKTFISEKAGSGVYLSVIGVGLGNTRDDLMETLALAGNGNYAYMDSTLEAEKVLGEELGGTLFTVAKDAKAGVTFHAETVSRYRIIGYDMKTMTGEEFDDPSKDAGELGSNLAVTVLYELELTENADTMSANALLATAEVRYKTVGEEANRSVTAEICLGSGYGEDQIFAGCVAEFGLILRQSEHRGSASLASVLDRLGTLRDYLARDAYKSEFETLVEKAASSESYE